MKLIKLSNLPWDGCMPLWISNFRMSCHLFFNSKVIRRLMPGIQGTHLHTWCPSILIHRPTHTVCLFPTPQKIHSCKHMCGRPGYEARPCSLHQRTAVLVQTCNYQIIRRLMPGIQGTHLHTGIPIQYVYSQPKKNPLSVGCLSTWLDRVQRTYLL